MRRRKDNMEQNSGGLYTGSVPFEQRTNTQLPGCDWDFFLRASANLAPELLGRWLPCTGYTESADSRTWFAFLPDGIDGPGIFAKGLLPMASQFAHGTLEERNRALAQEQMFTLANLFGSRFPVELAEVIRDPKNGRIYVGAVTTETQKRPADRYSQYEDFPLEPDREWAIVMRRVPSGSLDKNIASLSPANLDGLLSYAAGAMARVHKRQFQMEQAPKGGKEAQAAWDRKRVADLKYFGLEAQLVKNEHNERLWNGGRVEQWLRLWEQRANPSEVALVRFLRGIDANWPVFFSEMMSYSSYIQKLLSGGYGVRYAGPTLGDVKTSNIYQLPHGEFILLDPIGDINDPEYPGLYYMQEDLADLAMLVTDIEARLWGSDTLPEPTAELVLLRYMNMLRDFIGYVPLYYYLAEHERGASGKSHDSELAPLEFLIPELAKLHYYCATKARVGAIGSVVRDGEPGMAVRHLLVCDMHMRRARQLNAKMTGHSGLILPGQY